MDNKILAIFVAILVVASGVGIYAFMNQDGSTVEVSGDEATRLNICGNANMDNFLNQDDVKYLEGIIAGTEKKTALSDVNQDGKIDNEDIEMLNKIIKFESEEIWYLDLNGNYAVVKGKVNSAAVQYWPTVQAIIAVGAHDIIKYSDGGVLKGIQGGQYGETMKNAGVESFGSGFHSNYDFEKMISIGVDAIICGSADIYFIGIEDRFTDDTYINMIRLPFWEEDNVASAYLTLAYLLGEQKYVDKAYEYMNFTMEMKDLIDKNLSSLKEKKTILVTYYSAGSAELDVEVECRGCGSYECSTLAGLDNLAAYINTDGVLSSESMYYHTDVEYLLAKDPDYILMLHGGGFTKTEADQKAAFDKWTKYLTETTAYKNDGIMVSGSGVTSGLLQMNLALMLACEVYSDEMSGINSYDYLQKMVDNFTLMNENVKPGSADYFDVTEKGAYLYCTE